MNSQISESKRVLAVLLVPYFAYLLWQIFYFSDSFSMSWLRQIDDAVYHEDLKRIHLSLLNANVIDFFKSNNNGYGWVFWTTNGLATFPLYFLYSLGFKIPLVVSGRIICWLFTIASTAVIYKIAKKYTNNQLTIIAFTLTFVCFPHIPFWAMRFSSDASAFFFSTLAFYLSIRYNKHSAKTLLLVALTLGVAVGTKLTSIIILPFIFINITTRLPKEVKYSKYIVNLIYFFLLFTIFTIFFFSPGIFLYFKNKEYYQYSINMLNTYAALNVDVGDSHGSLLQILKSSIATDYLGLYSTGIFMLVISASFVFGLSYRRIFSEQLLAALTLIGAFLFLSLTVKKGSSYINVYFHSICFIFCFAYIAIERIGKYEKYLIVFLFSAFFVEQFGNLRQQFTAYANFSKTEQVLQLSAANNDIKSIVELSLQTKPIEAGKVITTLVDYRAIFPYTTIDKGFKTIALIDDISVRKKWSPTGYDYIVLSRNSPLLNAAGDVNTVTQNAESKVKNIFTESLYDVTTLIRDGHINNTAYSLVYDKNSILVYKRI